MDICSLTCRPPLPQVTVEIKSEAEPEGETMRVRYMKRQVGEKEAKTNKNITEGRMKR